jgi:hypothetical protein
MQGLPRLDYIAEQCWMASSLLQVHSFKGTGKGTVFEHWGWGADSSSFGM